MAGELILIVEDNEKNRKLVRDVLQFKGYRTLEAESGELGVALARESRPALILMDIQLPGMSGIEALGHLRADATTRGIPIVTCGPGNRLIPHQVDEYVDAAEIVDAARIYVASALNYLGDGGAQHDGPRETRLQA